MKRLRRRTIIALVLAGALAAGVLFFCFQLIGKGNDWVGFFGTRYYDSGAIYDRNGVLLYDGQTKSYAENQATRVSTLHLVGDQNFGTSLRSVLASRLTGYNLVTGTSLGSHDVTLTMVRGKILYAGGNYPTIDLPAVVRELAEYAMPLVFQGEKRMD